MMTKEAIEKLERLVLASADTFNVKAIIDRTAENDIPAAIVPAGHSLIDLEHLLAGPLSMRGTLNSSRIDSFASYVGRNRTSLTSIFVDDLAMTATAIIDHFEQDAIEPVYGWGVHRAVLKLEPVAAYKAICLDRPPRYDQKGFIDFLYDWQDVLMFGESVEGYELVAFTDAIKAIRKIDIKSAGLAGSEKQDFGHKRTAMESIELSGDIPIPGCMDLTCTPYVGLTSRKFKCRIFADVSASACNLSYRVLAHEMAVEEMVEEFTDLLSVHPDLNGIPIYNGSFVGK